MDIIQAFWEGLVDLVTLAVTSITAIINAGIGLIYTPAVGETPGAITTFGWFAIVGASVGVVWFVTNLIISRLPRGR